MLRSIIHLSLTSSSRIISDLCLRPISLTNDEKRSNAPLGRAKSSRLETSKQVVCAAQRSGLVLISGLWPQLIREQNHANVDVVEVLVALAFVTGIE